jgi:endonuclease YncB( thermonuclease family)
MFEYPAKLVRVVDGDTLKLEIDVGFNITRREASYRLLRINAPEMNTPEGQKAKTALEDYLRGKALVVQTFKSDSFGRYLIECRANGESVNDWMVQSGFAQYHTYS